MSKTIEISRELADRLASNSASVREEALHALRRLLAAPAVERKEPGAYVLAKQTAVEVPGQERKELGYTLFDGIGVFHTREEVHAAIAELGLPIGWVSMTVDQLLPGYMMPADSPPAPVAVALPDRSNERDHAGDWTYEAKAWNACLDEATRLNTK